MPAAPRIVPTGPESFAGEMVAVDADFFGGCCPDCAAGECDHPIEESEEQEIEVIMLQPVLVRR